MGRPETTESIALLRDRLATGEGPSPIDRVLTGTHNRGPGSTTRLTNPGSGEPRGEAVLRMWPGRPHSPLLPGGPGCVDAVGLGRRGS